MHGHTKYDAKYDIDALLVVIFAFFFVKMSLGFLFHRGTYL